jgi:hypothetical protein
MPLAGLVIALIDIACLMHIRQNGKPDYWFWVVLMLPGVGGLAYLLYEVLPNMGSSRTVKRIIKRMQPTAEMQSRLAEVEACGSMANKVALADECISTGQFDSAINLYMSCKTGIYEHDPTLLYGLGEANFYKGDYPEARRWFEDLISREAFFKAGEARLLYARTLESLEENEAALTQYEALSQQYAGEEPRVRMAGLLVRMGRSEAARRAYETVIKNTDRSPRHVQRMQKDWIEQARAALKELGAEAVH